MIASPKRSLLIVISAPSGTGKTTLCERLISEFNTMRYSVSCTTRTPRDGEVDGVDYHFIDENEFHKRVKAGAFLEYANGHGSWYGTLKATVEAALQNGEDILMDLDVQGATQMRRAVNGDHKATFLRERYIDVFIAPPSLDVLYDRLRGRGKDAQDVIERRVKQASHEMDHWREYQYFIVNDRLDASHDALRSIIIAEHHRVASIAGNTEQ